MFDTPHIDLNSLCTNEIQDDPDIDLDVLCDNDTQEGMSETPQVHLNALCTNESQDDLSLTPDLDFNVLCNKDTQEYMSPTPEIDSEEENVPQLTNTLADYPTPPELRGEPKSLYSDLTSSSDDEIVSSSLVLTRPHICTHYS